MRYSQHAWTSLQLQSTESFLGVPVLALCWQPPGARGCRYIVPGRVASPTINNAEYTRHKHSRPGLGLFTVDVQLPFVQRSTTTRADHLEGPGPALIIGQPIPTIDLHDGSASHLILTPPSIATCQPETRSRGLASPQVVQSIDDDLCTK